MDYHWNTAMWSIQRYKKYLPRSNSVKGLHKQWIINEFMPHVTVFDLENWENCPRLRELNEETLPCCIFHLEFNPKQCTLYKVFALKKWHLNNV